MLFTQYLLQFVITLFFILVAPVSVLIVNKGDQLVVGEPSDIVCRSSGSRPPAHITWYLDGKRIEGGTESVSFFSFCKHFIALKFIMIYFNVHIVLKNFIIVLNKNSLKE